MKRSFPKKLLEFYKLQYYFYLLFILSCCEIPTTKFTRDSCVVQCQWRESSESDDLRSLHVSGHPAPPKETKKIILQGEGVVYLQLLGVS